MHWGAVGRPAGFGPLTVWQPKQNPKPTLLTGKIMAGIDDKIQATKFIMNTTKSFDQIRALGLGAAASASGTITKVLEGSVDAGECIQYTVKRAGIFSVMSFGLVFSAAGGDASNTVMLVPGQYVTSQPTLLYFIPIGPKDSAGYPPLKKFSAHLRAALS
jgi:hypothetical protein